MKKLPLISAAAVLLSPALSGCVVAPVEPVYAAPPPPPVVVVRPAYRYHYYPYRPYYWRYR